MADSLVDYAPEFPSDGALTVAALANPTISAYADQSSALRSLTEANVLGLWDATIGAIPGLDPAASDLWLNAVGPMIAAAQQEEVSLTQAYMESLLSAALEQKIAATFDRKTLLQDLRNGTTNGQTYYRPVKTARTVMSVGGTRTQANIEAKKRLSSLVRTDLQLARMKTSQAIMSSDYAESVVQAQWHKRVLQGPRNCGLCLHASTRTYYKADLQPIHPGCDCIPMPQFTDPRKIVADPELLAQLKAAGITDDPKQIVIYKHGEYGPTLAQSGHRHLQSSAASARPDMDADQLAGREDRPVLGGWLAEDVDEMGRPIEKDWAEIVGVVGEKVEVASGPSIAGGTRQEGSKTTGPGIAYVTEDGRLFYAEFDPMFQDPQRAAGRMVDYLREQEQRSLPRGPDGEFWNPPNAVLSVQRLNQHRGPDGTLFQTSADAGRGRVVHYGGEIREETVWHENAHIVAGEVNKLASRNPGQIDSKYWSSDPSAPQAPGSGWEEAMEADESHLASAFFGDPDEGTYDGSIQTEIFSAWGAGVAPSHGVNRWGYTGNLWGTTPYGSSSTVEDFAEAWRLAVRGDIATYKPVGSDEWVTATFEEMYPNRYAYFKELERQLGVQFPF